MPNPRSIWIGFDPREAEGFAVTKHSILRRMNGVIPVRGLVMPLLAAEGLYWRDTQRKALEDGKTQLWDTVSNAPMATEFAISRFLVPFLARRMFGKENLLSRRSGLAIFMDSDMLVREDISTLFKAIEADPGKAVYCVKHHHVPDAGIKKMDGQLQTLYARKNWSSMMVFDTDHPAHAVLTPDMVNGLPGRDLHRFCWLDDSEIGDLDPKWNFLVGHSDPAIDPAIVHFTEGLPSMPGYERCAFSNEWRKELHEWAK